MTTPPVAAHSLSGDGRFIMERYRDLLPVTDQTPLVTLGEGGTPLIRSRVLEEELGLEALYFKAEFQNPTGSFKDRGMVVAVAKAAEAGAKAVSCASTGTTSASAGPRLRPWQTWPYPAMASSSRRTGCASSPP